MSTSQNQLQSPRQQRNKVRNVLTRYSGSKCVREDCLDDKTYLHPENAYLVKYFPKYYKRLTLLVKSQHSLLSKIKKIKKLKRFSGEFYDKNPPVNWFKILANNRKEIEELPKVLAFQAEDLPWAKTTLNAVKFFLNMVKLEFPTYELEESYPENSSAKWKLFSTHLRNMRKLKILEIYRNKDEIDPHVLKELNRTPRLLKQLEVLKCSLLSNTSKDVLSQNEKFLSYLTNLHYLSIPAEISPINQAIPKFCKNLTSFSLVFGSSYENFSPDLLSHMKSLDLILAVQELPKLQSISIVWAGSWSHDIWSYFIPPASLRSLKLEFKTKDLGKVVFDVNSLDEVDLDTLENGDEYESFFDHWKEIKELDVLSLKVDCANCEEMVFTKSFITAMLKKVSKLASFKCRTQRNFKDHWRYEPFEIKKVPHLYEHLKKFKVRFGLYEKFVSFDFGLLKPFKNLKEISFQEHPCCWVNIGDAVHLLEENTKNGEFSMLKVREIRINSKEELSDLLKRISNVKKDETNLKIFLALEFKIQFGDDEIMYLDQFCGVLESSTIKGLEISLDMKYQDYSDYDIDRVKEVLDKHPWMKNTVIRIYYDQDILEYIKRDGEKEQLLFSPEDY